MLLNTDSDMIIAVHCNIVYSYWDAYSSAEYG